MMKQKCKICDEETSSGFNINFKLVPICEDCATNIFLQQAIWYTKNLPKVIEEKVTESTEVECKDSPNGKHEFILPPDSFDMPYCKHCYKT